MYRGSTSFHKNTVIFRDFLYIKLNKFYTINPKQRFIARSSFVLIFILCKHIIL